MSSIFNFQNELVLDFQRSEKSRFLPCDNPMLFDFFSFQDWFLAIRKDRYKGFMLIGYLPDDFISMPELNHKLYNVYKVDDDIHLIRNFFVAYTNKLINDYYQQNYTPVLLF